LHMMEHSLIYPLILSSFFLMNRILGLLTP
jgi:hypothetical protein